jgi:dienelactone hydrolase
VVSYQRQLDDWRAAIDFVNKLPDVDGRRIGLWGTSYSGGHVLVVGGESRNVAAIVAQAAMADGLAVAKRLDRGQQFLCLWHAGIDLARAACGLSPHYVPVVGPQGRFAVMNRPGCEAGYRSLLPADSLWPNRCAARELVLSIGHRPVKLAARITCPVQLIVAERDQLIPRGGLERVAGQLRDCQLIMWPGDHFSIYTGEAFEELSRRQARFLADRLCDAA